MNNQYEISMSVYKWRESVAHNT